MKRKEHIHHTIDNRKLSRIILKNYKNTIDK